MDYSKAGVDIEKGDRFADFIANMESKAVSKAIGGFAGGLELDLKGIENPVLMSATDGVGTKLLVAHKLNKFDTLGIDLVAMCVNDLVVAGCLPLVFLDYIATGAINEEVLQNVMKGIVAGCELAECTLAGGETAEMPDVYKKEDFDLAGFCVGIADKKNLLPRKDEVAEGDVLIALPSSGVHSNGFSLARKAVPQDDVAVWEKMLTPTRIYVKEMKPVLESGLIKAAAHITGGGLVGNLVRVIPEGLTPEVTWDWEYPEIFDIIQKNGNIATEEMRKVFNMGTGLVMVVSADKKEELETLLKNNNTDFFTIGSIVRG